jgi:hypothetical protein
LYIALPSGYPAPSFVMKACPACQLVIRSLFDDIYNDVSLINDIDSYTAKGFVITVNSSNLDDPFAVSKGGCCFEAVMTEKNGMVALIGFDCGDHPP